MKNFTLIACLLLSFSCLAQLKDSLFTIDGKSISCSFIKIEDNFAHYKVRMGNGLSLKKMQLENVEKLYINDSYISISDYLNNSFSNVTTQNQVESFNLYLDKSGQSLVKSSNHSFIALGISLVGSIILATSKDIDNIIPIAAITIAGAGSFTVSSIINKRRAGNYLIKSSKF
jgi:hypothetical protein